LLSITLGIFSGPFAFTTASNSRRRRVSYCKMSANHKTLCLPVRSLGRPTRSGRGRRVASALRTIVLLCKLPITPRTSVVDQIFPDGPLPTPDIIMVLLVPGTNPNSERCAVATLVLVAAKATSKLRPL
jgi:hypothetical protein